jgi:citrate synthase
MSAGRPGQVIRTRIWHEEPEADNPFATRAAYCHGYDVYGEMLGCARWVEMLYLLFRGEVPSAADANLLEALAVALANPGPRDPSVHAAMCGGTCGSPAAANLMAALAVGAGSLGGAREVSLAMEDWAACGTNLAAWGERLALAPPDAAGGWAKMEHPPGFDPHGLATAGLVQQALVRLAAIGPPGGRLAWLAANLEPVQAAAGSPLALSGVAAAGFSDLCLMPDQGEMLYLLLRLPGAAVHALEQQHLGHRQFPFFASDIDAQLDREGQ